tara:strand:- start:665 stop:859 length:195 start_codon:yes stop_codon:yes gene_type:complete
MSYTSCKFYNLAGDYVGDALVADEADVALAGDKAYIRATVYNPEEEGQFAEVEAPQVSMTYVPQ